MSNRSWQCRHCGKFNDTRTQTCTDTTCKKPQA